ncbi:MAG: M16 family metallopeptidase [Planctomycetota bacterium]
MTGRIKLRCEERELKNGLCCIALQNPESATFAVSLSLAASQIEEAPNEHGLAYLTGSCLEEGTRRHSSIELAEAVENIGGSLSTAAGSVTIQCPADEAARAIRLVRTVGLEPAFDPRDVRRVQQEIASEIEADDVDPRAVARRDFRRGVFGTHPLGRPSYGDARTIAGFRAADLERCHRTWYAPRGAIVAASGPAPVEETLDVLAKAFRSFRGADGSRAVPADPEMPAERIETHVPMDREQVHVYLGHPGVRRSDPDFVPLLVMDHVLGTGPGFTSRVTRRLRDEMGLCYAVSASITQGAGLHPGAFTAYIGTSAGHRQRSIDVFLEEIRRIRSEPPSAQELQDVQEYLTGSYVFGLERNSNLVGYAIRARRYGLGYDYIHRYPDEVRAVTREDVLRAAATHLDAERVVIASAGATA